MSVTALVSGGKDSIYAASFAEAQAWPVDELLVVRPSDRDSMMFHTPNLNLVQLQGQAWGKRVRFVDPSQPGEVSETEALGKALETGGTMVVAGAIASSYQWGRLHRLCFSQSRRLFTPLWGKSAGTVVREEIRAGLDIRLVRLAAEGLDPELIGRRLDLSLLTELEHRSTARRAFNVAGEGGEFETLVVDAPFFNQRLELDHTEIVTEGPTTTLAVRSAHLAPKSKDH